MQTELRVVSIFAGTAAMLAWIVFFAMLSWMFFTVGANPVSAGDGKDVFATSSAIRSLEK